MFSASVAMELGLDFTSVTTSRTSPRYGFFNTLLHSLRFRHATAFYKVSVPVEFLIHKACMESLRHSPLWVLRHAMLSYGLSIKSVLVGFLIYKALY